MMHRCVASALLLAIVTVAFPVHAWSADELARRCRAAEAFDDGRSLDTSAMVDSQICTNYIMGFVAGRRIALIETSSADRRQACVPEGIRHAILTRVFLKHIRDHPEKLHLPAPDVLLDALRSAYPCKSE